MGRKGACACILDEAFDKVYGPRGADYGPPEKDFAKTAAMWTAMLTRKLRPEETVTPTDVGLMMICVKLSRLENQLKRDSLVDIAGYAETVGMILGEGDHDPADD